MLFCLFLRVPVKYGGIAQYPQVSLQPSSKRHGIASALATMPVLGLNWGCKATYLVLITLYSYYINVYIYIYMYMIIYVYCLLFQSPLLNTWPSAKKTRCPETKISKQVNRIDYVGMEGTTHYTTSILLRQLPSFHGPNSNV